MILIRLRKPTIGRRWFTDSILGSWTQPEGHPTGITLYNSLNRKKVPLLTRTPGLITWYMCGPTVYDTAHLGHAACYVKFDIIRRIMRDFMGHNVVVVMGVTDIDDKIIKRAQELKIDVGQLSRHYEAEFMRDMASLSVLPPDVPARVTEHIPQIIEFVEKILEKGLAYRAPDGSVYFDVSKYGRYGKFSKPQTEPILPYLELGKQSPYDFALWKASKPGEPKWNSPFGQGRPGWHIECSAMSNVLFGPHLDLHSGGIDLKFPHHENEEAQCCAYHGKEQWVGYWIHTGHLHLSDDQDKMSKSLGNFISISDYFKQGTANEFRILCLFSNYRHTIKYAKDLLVSARSVYRKLLEFLSDSEAYVYGDLISNTVDEQVLLKKLVETKTKVDNSLADDFDTARAMQAIVELVAVSTKMLHQKSKVATKSKNAAAVWAVASYVASTCAKLGINLHSIGGKAVSEDSVKEMRKILDPVTTFRSRVKKHALSKTGDDRKDLLQLCDEMRSSLMHIGIQLKDHGSKSSWTFIQDEKKEK